MENFNKLVPIDGENGEKRTISSLQIAEITGKAYCGVLKVIRKMDIGGCLYVSYCVLFGVDYQLVAAYMVTAFCLPIAFINNF